MSSLHFSFKTVNTIKQVRDAVRLWNSTSQHPASHDMMVSGVCAIEFSKVGVVYAALGKKGLIEFEVIHGCPATVMGKFRDMFGSNYELSEAIEGSCYMEDEVYSFPSSNKMKFKEVTEQCSFRFMNHPVFNSTAVFYKSGCHSIDFSDSNYQGSYDLTTEDYEVDCTVTRFPGQ